MSFKCGGCELDNVDCACADGAIHQCSNCGEAPSFKGSDDCVACFAAFLLTDPTQLALVIKLNSGTDWLRQLNAEISRQICAPIACGRQIAS